MNLKKIVDNSTKCLKDLDWRDNEIFAIIGGKIYRGQVKSSGLDFITFFYGDCCSITVRFDGKDGFNLIDGSINDTYAIFKKRDYYIAVSTSREEIQELVGRLS